MDNAEKEPALVADPSDPTVRLRSCGGTSSGALSGTARAAGASRTAAAGGTPAAKETTVATEALSPTCPPSWARIEAGSDAIGNIASQQSGKWARAVSEREQRRAATSAGGGEH